MNPTRSGPGVGAWRGKSDGSNPLGMTMTRSIPNSQISSAMGCETAKARSARSITRRSASIDAASFLGFSGQRRSALPSQLSRKSAMSGTPHSSAARAPAMSADGGGPEARIASNGLARCSRSASAATCRPQSAAESRNHRRTIRVDSGIPIELREPSASATGAAPPLPVPLPPLPERRERRPLSGR